LEVEKGKPSISSEGATPMTWRHWAIVITKESQLLFMIVAAVISSLPYAQEKLTSRKEAQANGQGRRAVELYRKFCVRCHGADGKGSANTSKETPDFTSRAWQERVSDAHIAVIVSDGKGSRMPSFHGRISSEQIPDLVDYLRTFGPARKQASQSDDFQRRFRELQEKLEELQKQFEELSTVPKKKN
jgi:mono/diheme cytochrome c family protein